MHSFEVKSKKRQELIYISSSIAELTRKHGKGKKSCVIFVPHTTAGLTINENADPDVKSDIIFGLNQMVPIYPEFKHAEGNSDAHIKASLLGASETILIENGQLLLGTWQGIFLAEFDGPRNRKVFVQFIG